MFSSSGLASCQESGNAMILGAETSFCNRNSLCTGDRCPARSLGIARNHKVVGDRPALNVIFGSPRTIGIYLALPVAVLGGIAVNKKCGYSFALRGKRLESAIAIRIGVAHQYDLSFHADPVFAQQIVILRITAVRVDQRCGDFSRNRHAQPCATDRRVFRIRIAVERGFTQPCLIVCGRDHLQRGALRIRAIHVVAADNDVLETLLLPLIANVFGELVVALRARDMGFLREDAVLPACFVGAWDGFELGFDIGFAGGGLGSET